MQVRGVGVGLILAPRQPVKREQARTSKPCAMGEENAGHSAIWKRQAPTCFALTVAEPAASVPTNACCGNVGFSNEKPRLVVLPPSACETLTREVALMMDKVEMGCG